MNIKVAVSRLSQHIGRARLVVEQLRQSDQAPAEELKHRLGAVMDELDMAASILRAIGE
jgi:hypothetical protein